MKNGDLMKYIYETVAGILLPFIGTTAGAAAVFFMKKQAKQRFHKLMLGFAAGVMTAASVWSLLIPSIESTNSWIPAVVGFLIGIGSMMGIDTVLPETDFNRRTSKKFGDNFLMFLAVTVHNIPEGMAVGVAFSGMLSGGGIVSPTEALALSIGISVQNFPEGTIISAPLASVGMDKKKAFLYGVLSGAVEPTAALITMLMTRMLAPILPYVLSFAAGAMIYVVTSELIPAAKSKAGTGGTALGFAVMMLLDVALG